MWSGTILFWSKSQLWERGRADESSRKSLVASHLLGRLWSSTPCIQTECVTCYYYLVTARCLVINLDRKGKENKKQRKKNESRSSGPDLIFSTTLLVSLGLPGSIMPSESMHSISRHQFWGLAETTECAAVAPPITTLPGKTFPHSKNRLSARLNI